MGASYNAGSDLESFGGTGLEDYKSYMAPVGDAGVAYALCDNVEVESAVAEGLSQTRETECDLVYTGLVAIEANRVKTLNIKLPDSIGAYDITAFSVSDGDWIESGTEFSIYKSMYVIPAIPAYAHPEDGVKCRAYVVACDSAVVRVSVDGKRADFEMSGSNPRVVEWDAVPGVHEVSVAYQDDVDKVVRVVECPGEETVLAQELRILKKGEAFDISRDENALSIVVVPGMENEFKAAIHVVTDFQHKCCEQTSAAILASAIAIVTGGDSEKEKGFDSIVKGEQRLKSMYSNGAGKPHFLSYPGGSFYENWSDAAAKRCSKLADVLSSATLPDDAAKAVDSLTKMGKAIMLNVKEGHTPMEDAYYAGTPPDHDVDEAITELQGAGAWDYSVKSEAAFLAAALIKAKSFDKGIKLANACAKAMGGAMGGAMHGSYECLAYLHLIHELKVAGIVSGAAGSKVTVNDREVPLATAMEARDIRKVEAKSGAVAIKVTRLERIRFDEAKTAMQMSLDIASSSTSNSLVRLKVKIDSYKDGDVLCVCLPDCLSRMVAGAKVKKFQVDFKGKKEAEVELVAHDKTAAPQRWAAVVRNMYDGSRIGSVGMLRAEVV